MLLRGGLRPPKPRALSGSQGRPRPALPPAAAAAAAAMSRSVSPGRSRAPTSPHMSKMSWRNPTIFFGEAAAGASGVRGGVQSTHSSSAALLLLILALAKPTTLPSSCKHVCPACTLGAADACRGVMQLVSLGRGAQQARHAHASDDAEAELESVLPNGPLASAPRPQQTRWPLVVSGQPGNVAEAILIR